VYSARNPSPSQKRVTIEPNSTSVDRSLDLRNVDPINVVATRSVAATATPATEEKTNWRYSRGMVNTRRATIQRPETARRPASTRTPRIVRARIGARSRSRSGRRRIGGLSPPSQ
jgi:hypothetical protein